MQRTLLASVIVMSLSACDGGLLSSDSDNVKTLTDPAVIGSDTNTESISDDAGSASSDGGENTGSNGSGDNLGVFLGFDSDDDADDKDDDYYDDDKDDDDGKYDDNDDDDTGDNGNNAPISDDAGSSSSDGGETGANNDGTISDDAGSATSDGGISDDAGSATSDGGISDDAGSATSDGGISDDAGSASSDGGITDDAGSASSDGGNDTNTGGQSTPTTPDTDAGDFESDSVGGNVLRTSTLSTTSQQNICTTASAQNNFSDTRIGDFILHNNAWRPWRAAPGYEWEQCIYTNTNGAVVGWNYDWGPGQVGINGSTRPSGDFYVRSYPELIYGVKDEFRTSAPKSVTGFPVELAQMPNITIDYSYNGPQYGESRVVDASNNPRFPNGTTISGERNVAIESFLYNKDAAGQCSEGIVTRTGGSNHVYEVMVWLDAGAERLPAGPSDFVANLTIRGADYKVYTKASDPRYIAFVAQTEQTSGTIYWNDFMDWARENAHQVQQRFGARSNSVQIQDDWCVANIIVGTEIFWGAGNLDIYDWTITQRN